MISTLWSEVNKMVFDWMEKMTYNGLLTTPAAEPFRHERKHLHPGKDFEYIKSICGL